MPGLCRIDFESVYVHAHGDLDTTLLRNGLSSFTSVRNSPSQADCDAVVLFFASGKTGSQREKPYYPFISLKTRLGGVMMNTPDHEWRFLHAADLHLDAAFQGVSASPAMPDAVRQMLRDATFQAFDRLIHAAREHDVRLVLFGGDQFNSAEQSVRARLAFAHGLERLAEAGIVSVAVHGNHDPWTASLGISIPETAHIFGPEPDVFEHTFFDGLKIVIAGASHANAAETRNLTQLIPSPKKHDAFHAGLVHCHVATAGLSDRHDRYAACALEDFEKSGMDYWALGHIHQMWRGGTRMPVVYPGALQGLHINETGPHGAILGTVRQTQVTDISFLPMDVVRWMVVSVSLDVADTLDGLHEAMRQAVLAASADAEGRHVVVRIRLEGRGSIYPLIVAPDAQEDLLSHLRGVMPSEGSFIWIESIAFFGRPMVDDVALLQDSQHLAGEVLRQACMIQKQDGSSSQNVIAPEGATEAAPQASEDIHAILENAAHGYGALSDVLNTFLKEASEEEKADMLQQATALLMDQLCDPN